jgi:hypothetical protein
MSAVDYLERLLAAFPPGQRLLAEIREFYGPTFDVTLHENPDGRSRFEIDTGAAKMEFQKALIELNTATDRTVAAAVHELLHLRMPIRGFNPIHAIDLAPRYHAEFPRIDKLLRMTVNIVHHDIFVDEFVAAGLPLSHFLCDGSPPARYGEEAKQSRGKVLVPERAWIAWSWWSFQFFNCHLSRNHGDEQAERLASSATKWGNRVLPGFDKKTEKIKAWAARGGHKHANTYITAMSELAELMCIPATLKFCVLKLRPSQAPQVEPIG